MTYTSKKFDFTNAQGEWLSGRLELPSQPVGFAIFAHCFTCSKNILAATRISRTLSAMGLGVLRFDFTGLGNSEGDFSNTNFSSNVQDIQAAYQALEKKYQAPSLLIGHSLGGAAVLKISPELPEVKAVVTIGAPSDTAHVAHLFQCDLERIHEQGEADVQLAGRQFKIKKQFIDDIQEQNILEGLAKAKQAYLIMHSPLDETVSIDHAAKIYSALKHPKSYVSLDKADHLVSQPMDAEYIASMIRAWGERYVERKQVDRPEVEENILTLNRPGHQYTMDIHSQDHQLVADEPKKVKGDHLGMNPYELLLSSLGACTAMTIKMYCARKNIHIEKVQVDLSHQKKTEDCIIKKIQIQGDFTPEQKERILEIAEKCPVNKTLTQGATIKSEYI